MPASTAKGYPYPLGTDRLMDGDDAIKALAEAADVKAGISAAGTGTIPQGTIGTATSLAVTFPAGRFTVAPVVQICCGNTTNPQNVAVGIQPPTAAGFTAWGTRIAGGNSTIAISWHARITD